jgi:hypothetical protein
MDPAQTIGAVIGGLIGAFLIALLIRFIYVLIRRGDRRVFDNKWIWVITVVLLFLSAAGRAGNG